MEVHVPKPRGRPRASFAQTGEFDLSLIREYQSRPALYDRDSKHFKDKIFTAQQWQMISHKLGYDVSLLKDRMLQLRNRFNIEKRRLDQMREDANDETLDSPWPLFENLTFLSDHIRTRRSYKSFSNKSGDYKEGKGEMDNSDENCEGEEAETSSSGIIPDVKVEMESETDVDAEENLPAAVLKVPSENTKTPTPGDNILRAHSTRLSQKAATTTPAAETSETGAADATENEGTAVNDNAPSTSQVKPADKSRSLNMLPPNITIRRVDGKHIATTSLSYITAPSASTQKLATPQPKPALQVQQPVVSLQKISNSNKSTHATPLASSSPTKAATKISSRLGKRINTFISTPQSPAKPSNQIINVDDDDDGTKPPSPKRQRSYANEKHAEKYRAFGEFVGSSLLDLPPRKALRLVDKFTTELVQTLMKRHDDDDEGENNPSNDIERNTGNRATNGLVNGVVNHRPDDGANM